VSIDWNDLYRTTFPDLVRFLHRKVWDVERARDLAQETFVRALREEPENPRAWLFHVASNLARDEARTVLRRRQHLTLLAGGEADRSAPTDPHTELVEAEQRRALRRALEGLGERDREVLLLWNAGLDYREIAERAGLSPGAVGTTLARARKRLVAAYENEEGDHVARG
jgi:RNA polymerase sigma-70 factor (ECF subfamily)